VIAKLPGHEKNIFIFIYHGNYFLYLSKTFNLMKAFNILLIAASAVTLASCGGAEEKTAEKATYTLDVNSSSLKWKGSEGPEYFHTGSIKFLDGTVEMEGDKLINGNFTVDMNAITVEDKELPEEKKGYLTEHLKDTSFFFVAEFPKVTVSVNGYENGKLSTTINVRGQEVKENIPVKLTFKEKTVTISGKFSIDFAALKMEGMEPDPESGDKIDSKVEYDLQLNLNKK
jgi:polyisoprenoid-binding protein YceI